MNLVQIATCAVALTELSASSAQAAPALATDNVNMRQGPGTNYPVITTIPGGSTVEVSGCQGEWCSVSWHGQSGYAIAARLDQGEGAPPPSGAQGPPPASAGPTPSTGAGGPPPGASAGGPYPPPGYPPPGYPPPPGYYYAPGYAPYYYPRPYYYRPYYRPYWYRRWW